MKLQRNYYNPSNSKNIGIDKSRELENEIDFYLQENENIDISKTRVYKRRVRKERGNEYRHHVISHGG